MTLQEKSLEYKYQELALLSFFNVLPGSPLNSTQLKAKGQGSLDHASSQLTMGQSGE